MKLLIKSYCNRHRFLLVVLSVILLSALSREGFAQEPPPRPLVVTVTQNLGFGAFTHGAAGGTITMSSSGTRSSTGTVIPLNLGYLFSAAIYQLLANPRTLITILNVPDVLLSGSNSGFMTLHIVTPSQLVITTDPPAFTLLNIGGTLTVGNTVSNPPGNYNGSFDITFLQE